MDRVQILRLAQVRISWDQMSTIDRMLDKDKSILLNRELNRIGQATRRFLQLHRYTCECHSVPPTPRRPLRGGEAHERFGDMIGA